MKKHVSSSQAPGARSVLDYGVGVNGGSDEVKVDDWEHGPAEELAHNSTRPLLTKHTLATTTRSRHHHRDRSGTRLTFAVSELKRKREW
jgi:hypothetical protein